MKKISFAIIFFIAGIVLAAVISSSAVRQAYRSKKIENEVLALQEEARRIQNENETISQRIEYYSTPQFIERVSKDKMNLQKPDENVIVVNQRQVAGASDEKETEGPILAEEKDRPNYLKWWKLFF